MKKFTEAGFLLVEILVAVSVVALVLGTLLLAYSRSLKNAETSKKYQQAALLAEQKIWEYLWTDTLTAGSSSGVFEDHPEMEWQSIVTLLYHPPEEEEEEEEKTASPAEPSAPTPGPVKEKREKLPPTDLYQITVSVAWPEPGVKRDFELSTYTLVPVPEEEKEAPHGS